MFRGFNLQWRVVSIGETFPSHLPTDADALSPQGDSGLALRQMYSKKLGNVGMWELLVLRVRLGRAGLVVHVDILEKVQQLRKLLFKMERPSVLFLRGACFLANEGDAPRPHFREV